MPVYIDPVLNIGGFGNVHDDTLTFDGTIGGSSNGGTGFSAFKAQPDPPVAAHVPGWMIVVLVVGVIVAVTSERT